MKLHLPCPLAQTSLVSCEVVEDLANPAPQNPWLMFTEGDELEIYRRGDQEMIEKARIVNARLGGIIRQ